jgi:hypothetical protein
MVAEVTAMAPVQIYQGTVALRAMLRVEVERDVGAKVEAGCDAEDMLPPDASVEMIRAKY